MSKKIKENQWENKAVTDISWSFWVFGISIAVDLCRRINKTGTPSSS
jgi:hypothetical protein